MEPSLSELMRRSQEGDESAYKVLLSKLYDLAAAYVRPKIKDSTLRQDIVQEILLAVHAGRGTFDPACPFEPWFYAIARNKLCDFLRTLIKRSAVKIDDSLSCEKVGIDECAELKNDLMREIALLSVSQREIFTLSRHQGFSHREIGEFTKASEVSVRVSLHRIMNRLRNKLTDHPEEVV